LSERRRLSGLAFLALAVILAWGGTVDPTKAWARWLGVVVLGCFGVISLFSDRMSWLPARDRIESAYLQMMMAGVAVGAVAWLIPSSGSQGLLVVAGLLVVLPLGLWIRVWLRSRQTDHDDTHRPR
jgi:hypothetical protein